MARRILATAFVITGVLHFVRPQTFAEIVPSALPAHTELVYVSGVAELACAFGLFKRARWAPWATIALLVAVFPANIQMAIDWQHDEAKSTLMKLGAWIRLPLQLPLIALALKSR